MTCSFWSHVLMLICMFLPGGHVSTLFLYTSYITIEGSTVGDYSERTHSLIEKIIGNKN